MATDKRLYRPGRVRQLLDDYNFKFSKGLGQNFLIDGNIVRKIAEAAEVTAEDNILEIGPGFGTLTEELALHAKKVVAVEIDCRLLPVLEETLGQYDNVVIKEGDILKLSIQELIDDAFDGEPVKVVANLPYYITTPIIAKLLEEDLPITSLTVMVQKEVAERMVATEADKAYGSLSLFIRYYAEPTIALTAPKTVFMPPPKIDSSVVHLKKRPYQTTVDSDALFQLIHSGFNQRRKTITNSLMNTELGFSKEALCACLEVLNIPPKSRAENLSLEAFVALSACLSSGKTGY